MYAHSVIKMQPKLHACAFLAIQHCVCVCGMESILWKTLDTCMPGVECRRLCRAECLTTVGRNLRVELRVVSNKNGISFRDRWRREMVDKLSEVTSV